MLSMLPGSSFGGLFKIIHGVEHSGGEILEKIRDVEETIPF